MGYNKPLVNTRKRRAETVCPLDCADTRSLNVDIRGQQIVSVRGSKANPLRGNKLTRLLRNALLTYSDQYGSQAIFPLKYGGPMGGLLGQWTQDFLAA